MASENHTPAQSGLAPLLGRLRLGRRKGRSLFTGQSQATLGQPQLQLARPSRSSQGQRLPISCPGLKIDHLEFDGTVGELKSRSQLGCQTCSTIYDGVVAIAGSCTGTEDCELFWKPRGVATLSVSIWHACELGRLNPQPRFVEFFHDLGPFDSLDEMSMIRYGVVVPRNPVDSLKRMLGWIRNCEMSHAQCAASNQPLLPKRVVDVGNWQQNGHSVHLYESNGDSAQYVALSHRWGTNQLLKTTIATLQSRKQKIAWTELSQTFQDAIVFTAKLGKRYLWIDSLCIIQDSKADWQEQSSKMASVYENAFVTLAANRSEDDSKGLFGPRAAKVVEFELNNPGRPRTTMFVREPLRHGQFYQASAQSARDNSYPLFERAWCFQERILATRILHFTKSEVVFECKDSCKCECTSIGLRGESFIKAFYQNLFAGKQYVNSWVGWRTVVSDYSKNKLTDSHDILPALAGVSSRLQCRELGQFYAGLWENEMRHGLFWYTTKSRALENEIFTAPTFSWASLIGRADFQDLRWTDCEAAAPASGRANFQFLDAVCKVNGRNKYGEVVDGHVRLIATCHYALVRVNYAAMRPSLELTAMFDNSTADTYYANTVTKTSRVFLDKGWLEAGEDVMQRGLTIFVGYWNDPPRSRSISIKMGTGLVLEKIKDTISQVPHTYRRIGYFEELPFPYENLDHPGMFSPAPYGSPSVISIY